MPFKKPKPLIPHGGARWTCPCGWIGATRFLERTTATNGRCPRCARPEAQLTDSGTGA